MQLDDTACQTVSLERDSMKQGEAAGDGAHAQRPALASQTLPHRSFASRLQNS